MNDDAREETAPQREVPGPARIRQLCHDLNNPLAVVMGQLEMIAEFHPELPDDMKHRLGELSTAAETMRRVIMEAAKEARRAMGEKG